MDPADCEAAINAPSDDSGAEMRVVERTEHPHIPSLELWDFHKQKRHLRKAYLDHWQATVGETGTGRPVDAIIAPVAPFAAPPHGHYKYA